MLVEFILRLLEMEILEAHHRVIQLDGEYLHQQEELVQQVLLVQVEILAQQE